MAESTTLTLMEMDSYLDFISWHVFCIDYLSSRSGIKSCKPGGSVVYSTCTVSPVQNDGIIQDTLDYLWKETPIGVEIEDISEIREIFQDTYRFFNECRFGQLVIPSLSQNYGPMYVCKLRRVS